MPKGEPELSSELKNFDSRSHGILATDVWTSVALPLVLSF